MKKSTLIPLFLFGEMLIVSGFYLFAKGLAIELQVLYILVVSLLFVILFFDPFLPWVNRKDPSQKKIGSIGIKWFFTGIYSLLTISFILYCLLSQAQVSAGVQWLIHGVFFFFFLTGMFAGATGEKQVAAVYAEQSEVRKLHISMIKKTHYAIKKLKALPTADDIMFNQMQLLEEDLRYITPSDESDARILEMEYIKRMEEILFLLDSIKPDREQILKKTKECREIYNERKRIFSK